MLASWEDKDCDGWLSPSGAFAWASGMTGRVPVIASALGAAVWGCMGAGGEALDPVSGRRGACPRFSRPCGSVAVERGTYRTTCWIGGGERRTAAAATERISCAVFRGSWPVQKTSGSNWRGGVRGVATLACSLGGGGSTTRRERCGTGPCVDSHGGCVAAGRACTVDTEVGGAGIGVNMGTCVPDCQEIEPGSFPVSVTAWGAEANASSSVSDCSGKDWGGTG